MSLLANAFLPPGDASARCVEFLTAKTACDWTVEWSCPGSSNPGRSGLAGEDGSLAFFCCCKVVFPAELQYQRKLAEDAELRASAQVAAKKLVKHEAAERLVKLERKAAPKPAVKAVPKLVPKPVSKPIFPAPTPAPTAEAEPITTYVIAPQDGFWEDQRVARLRKLGLEVVRADPVSSVTPCEVAPNDNGMRGILLAHRNVWSAVALTGKRSLVLEADWMVNKGVTDAQLVPALRSAHERDEDYTSVGWCDLCDEGLPEQCHDSPWSYYVAGCTHAYFVSPGAARALARTDFCIASDAAMLGSCGNLGRDAPHAPHRPQWAHDQATLIGRNLSCSWLEEPSYRPTATNATLSKASVLHQAPLPTFRGLFAQNISASQTHFGSAMENRSDAAAALSFRSWRQNRRTALAAMGYPKSAVGLGSEPGHKDAAAAADADVGSKQESEESADHPGGVQRSGDNKRHRLDMKKEPTLHADLRAVDELFANYKCKHIYLDLGTAIGVQIRKLYQPQLYPKATALEAFDEDFGTGPRCNVCTFGFEPNPEHSARLDTVQAKLRAHGVGVHIFKKAAYTSYTRLQFATGKEGGREQVMHVEAVDLAPIIQRMYSHLGKGGIITAKMDIEGDEFALLPHLERSQALCLISRIQILWHPQYYDEKEGRKAAAALGLESDVSGAKASEASVRQMELMMNEIYAHPTGECKAWLQEKQDITYEHDDGNDDDWPQGACKAELDSN
jgi:hypothetical protein